MSVINEIGGALGMTNKKVWMLKGIDNPNIEFVGQFQAENLVENVGARIPETTPVGSQTPAIQWQNGETESLSFNARIFRTSPIQGAAFDALSNPVGAAFDISNGKPLAANGSVREQIEKLKQLARKNEDLGRQERFVFTYGSEMRYEVFIRSLGGIQYDDIRSDGTIRGASFFIDLVKISAENSAADPGVSMAAKIKATAGVISTVVGGVMGVNNIKRNKLIKIPGASYHTISRITKAKQGDTFEKIAQREYGNAGYGDILRRAQPERGELKPGDDVVLIRKEEVVQISVTPQSVCLRDNTASKLLLTKYLELRGKSATVVI